MHDFLLAKQIADELGRVAIERKFGKIRKVTLEIGSIAMSHDGHPEHLEEISPDNLRFGLESVFEGGAFEGAEFDIRKAEGDSWKIVSIDVS